MPTCMNDEINKTNIPDVAENPIKIELKVLDTSNCHSLFAVHRGPGWVIIFFQNTPTSRIFPMKTLT